MKVKLIIGLGNPGKEYEKTCHNSGKLFIDYLKNLPANSEFKIQNSELFQFIKTDNSVFVKPLTFMNESGKAVSAAMKYFKIKPEEILVVHDDSDIELGKYKISFGRGSAGHNGVESIIKSLKTKNFWRLRIGIRPPIHINQRQKAAAFVLKKISKKNLEILNKTFEKIMENYNFNVTSNVF